MIWMKYENNVNIISHTSLDTVRLLLKKINIEFKEEKNQGLIKIHFEDADNHQIEFTFSSDEEIEDFEVYTLEKK